MIIDANLYWLPEELFTDEDMAERFLHAAGSQGYTARMETLPAGLKQIVIEKPAGAQNLNYVQHDYLLEKQLADLDAAGADSAVLKLPGCQEWMDIGLCRQFNDGLAAHAARSGGRLAALAVLPPEGTPEVRAELHRCLHELGMHGVQLSAHYNGRYLDDASFAPFFSMLQEEKATVYVHHTPLPVEYDSLLAYDNLRRSCGRCVDQITAVMRELLSDMFEQYPDVKLVHSMLGGGFFAFRQVAAPHKPKLQETVARFQTDGGHFEEHLQRNVFFEMSHAQPWGAEALEAAVRILGADHVIFGTSYPVRREWLLDGPAFVNGLQLSPEEKQAVLGGNAAALYHMG